MRGSLFKQGLCLALVPVSLTIVFVVILAGLLQEAERDIGAEYHAKMVISSAHELLTDFYEWGAVIKMFHSTKDDMILQKSVECTDRIKKHLKSMEKLTAQNPTEATYVKEISQASNRVIEAGNAYLVVYKRTGGSGGLGMEMQESLHELLMNINHFIQVEEQQASTRLPEDKAKSRQNVVTFLYLGSVFIIVIGIMLVISFERGAVHRLRTLVENSWRLADNQPLLDQVPGNDEIAHLDSVFHTMARQLNAAAKHKQELMQMVSHDLKTPLSSVQIALSSLADGIYGDLPKEAVKQLQLAEFNATRLIHLIRDLLDIDRLEAGKLSMNFEETAVDDVIQQSVSAVQAYADRHELSISYTPTTARINADCDRLVQVLVNILSNAIKFSPRNTTITITVEENIETTEIRIADQGRGIPEENLETIFDRFQQVRKEDATQHQGSGLGLAIAKAIVEAHHGNIGVESEKGKGSTFWIAIPPTTA